MKFRKQQIEEIVKQITVAQRGLQEKDRIGLVRNTFERA